VAGSVVAGSAVAGSAEADGAVAEEEFPPESESETSLKAVGE
jgi:hypothetical protein